MWSSPWLLTLSLCLCESKSQRRRRRMAKPPHNLFHRHSQFLGLVRSRCNRVHYHDKPSISVPAGSSFPPSSAIHCPDPLSKNLAFSSRIQSFTIQSQRLSAPYPIPPPIFSSGFGARLYANSSGLRHFSSGGRNLGKVQTNASFPKSFLDPPLRSLRSAFYRYREAVGLQIEAFWKRNYMFLLGAGGLVLCAVLWKVMFGIATTFVGLSEGMAKYGFLALSASIVAFSVSYFHISGSFSCALHADPLIISLSVFEIKFLSMFFMCYLILDLLILYRIGFFDGIDDSKDVILCLSM